MSVRNKNIILTGSEGVGKTCFLDKFNIFSYQKNYPIHIDFPIVSEIRKITFKDEKSSMNTSSFIIWTCNEQETYCGLENRCYQNSNGAIVMFDVTSKLSYKEAVRLCKKLRQMFENLPIVLCGNKVDCKNREITRETAMRLRNIRPIEDMTSSPNMIRYHETSSKVSDDSIVFRYFQNDF